MLGSMSLIIIGGRKEIIMLSKLVLSVVVAVVVTLACTLLGSILIALNVSVAATLGAFLKGFATVLGILAGLWYFFAGNARWPIV